VSELRYALRALTKRPGPTMVIVMTLGVAIASATVIYSVIDMVWHLLPAVRQDRLVYIASTGDRVVTLDGESRSVVVRMPASIPDLADWRARASSFDQLAGFSLGSATLSGVEVPLRVTAIGVTANLPDVWGLTPTLGRPFRDEEGQPGSAPVVLLSRRFWQQQFSASPSVLGQSVLLDSVPHTVVGVLPAVAQTGFFKEADVFTPLVLDPLRRARDQRDVLVTGRLKPGITRAQAGNELDTIASQLRAEYPATNKGVGTDVLPLIEASGLNVRILVSILTLIGLLVLVVACANVASVMVAQSMARRHELAVHAALGATRADRIRQLMGESAMVSAASCVVGLLLAAWGIAALRWLGSNAFGFAEMEMNGRVFAASLLIACATPVGFGLLPALRIGAPDPQELRDGTRAAGATLRGRRVRHLIVGLQACAAVILLVQIGLFVRFTWKLQAVPSGFDPAQVATFHVSLPPARYDSPQAIEQFIANLTTRVRGLPGVASIGVIDRLPVADSEQNARLTVEGTPLEPLESRPLVARSAIAGDYLTALRIPIRRGRAFSAAEISDAAPVAIVNEEAARRFWPGRDPIGSRIALDATAGQIAWLETVGVAGNIRNSDIDQGPFPQVYVSTSRQPPADFAVVVKSAAADPLALVPAIRAQVASIDSNQPIFDVATMSQVLYDDLAVSYILTAILTTVGLVALVLSAAGIYGLVSFSVAQRRKEIGVRMALGARPDWIVRMIVAHTARPVATGSVLGLAAAIAVSLALAAGIPELDPRDPISYAGVILLIALAAGLASVIPARRAASVNPVEALRAE
jgi:putative ABC transport system permease protein